MNLGEKYLIELSDDMKTLYLAKKKAFTQWKTESGSDLDPHKTKKQKNCVICNPKRV